MDDILTRFKPKDYNNVLEEILEKKEFSNDVKNLLLSMLYKVETGYNDYKKVKIDVLNKKIIIEEIVMNINDNCSYINLINPKEKIGTKNKKFKIDFEDNSITTYPREKDLLRAVYNLSYREIQTDGIENIVKDSFSRFINIGYSNDAFEIIRDFDGWNWNTVGEEIENFEYNLIYQNLKILTNNEYIYGIKQWENKKVDFDATAREQLEKNVNITNTNEFMKYFYKSIITLNKQKHREIEKILQIKTKEDLKLKEIKRKERYVQELVREKKNSIDKIRSMQGTLNNPQKLNEEFVKRNRALEAKSKIFSISNLTEIINGETEQLEDKIEEIELKIARTKCTEEEENTKKVVKFIEDLELESMFSKEEIIIKLQKAFLNCFMEFIKKAETKKQIIELIYTFRYYCLLHYNDKTQIKDVRELKIDIKKIKKELIFKSISKKIFNELSVDENLNIEIISPIFELSNIELDHTEIKIFEDIVNTHKLKVDYLDNGIIEKTKEIRIESIRQVKGLKFNKKMKLFN